MKDLHCIACESFDGTIQNIVLFGLVRPVVRDHRDGLEKYCTAVDQHGNQYDIFTDYDPALRVSYSVAVPKGAE